MSRGKAAGKPWVAHPMRTPPPEAAGMERALCARNAPDGSPRDIHEATAWGKDKPWWPRRTTDHPYGDHRWWFWILMPTEER